MKAGWILIFVWGMTRVALGQETSQEGQKAAPPGTPQDRDTLDRIERLERELQELKTRQLSGQTGVPTSISLDNPPSTGDVEFRITFTDGFHVKSSDGNFDLHIGGRVEEVYREIFDRPILGGAAGASGPAAKLQPNTFYFHELFLSMDGTIYKDFGFKINGDFAPQAVNATNPAVLSSAGVQTGAITGSIAEQAWLEWKHFDWLHVQFGQFKSPNEAESIESPLFQEVVNRSPMSRFVQNWETGMQIYGSFLESLFTYNVALMNGRGHLANAGRSLVDDNDGKEVDWRLTVAPFVQDADSYWLRGLRFGWWGSYAREGQGTPRTGSNTQGFPPGAGFQSTDFGVSYLEFGAAPQPFVFHGTRTREGAELTYVAGPFEIRGEVMERRDEFFVTATAADRFLGMKGYYGQVSCILTGEDKVPDTRIVPRHPLDPMNGDWGAVELAARFGGVTIDRAALNQMLAPANPIAANSNRMTSLAAGINWWFTKNTKLAFDYVTEHYYDGILFAATGPNVDRKHLNGFLAQVQLDF